jgi:hypothetical protein
MQSTLSTGGSVVVARWPSKHCWRNARLLLQRQVTSERLLDPKESSSYRNDYRPILAVSTP